MLHYSGQDSSGKVNLRAMNQGSGAPLLAFSPREAKSEILALSRDS